MTEIHSVRDVIDNNAIVGAPKAGPSRFWTTVEDKILTDSYSVKGLEGCVPLLPGRTASAIYNRASQSLGLSSGKRTHDFRNQKWTSSPQIDAVVTRVYQATPTKNQINQCAKTLGRPRWWVSKRAAKLGLVSPRFKEPPWTEAEIEVVTENAHKSPKVLKGILARRGYARTETAITVKLKRLGTPVGRNADFDHYTACHLAKLFGVDAHGVTAWIKKGWLKAVHRGTDRTPQQGGDEYKIHRKAVRAFIVDNVASIDIRKVDKFWFVDLVANRDIG